MIKSRKTRPIITPPLTCSFRNAIRLAQESANRIDGEVLLNFNDVLYAVSPETKTVIKPKLLFQSGSLT